MEDDSGVRNLTVNALTYCVNREVLSFRNGLSAWDFLENGGKADIIVSDVDMPKMNGFDLLTKVKSRWPDKIFIIMSGVEGNEKMAEQKGADGFLSKPFSITDLFNIVQAYVVD